MSAADRWRECLTGWALPSHVLAAVPDSPYEWPVGLWRRGSGGGAGTCQTPTGRVLARLLPPAGSLLDVGAGMGRASLPAALRGHRLTAVERDIGMAAALRQAAAATGVEARVVEGCWPEVAEEAGEHDVALSAHVVYDVPELAPFLRALHGAARVGVVLEAGERHPWSGLTKYYRALHGLDRPAGPDAALLLAVVAEAVGERPQAEHWTGTPGLRFADLQELVGFYRKRLLVPVERSGELAALLVPDVVEEDGWLRLGGASGLVTVWWARR